MKSSVWLAVAVSALVAGPVLGWCGGGPHGERMAEARAAALTQADADGNGALSAEEFLTFEEAMQRSRAEVHFACMDADGDGKVTAEELEQARPPRPPRF